VDAVGVVVRHRSTGWGPPTSIPSIPANAAPPCDDRLPVEQLVDRAVAVLEHRLEVLARDAAGPVLVALEPITAPIVGAAGHVAVGSAGVPLLEFLLATIRTQMTRR
jgi:hypothetical protein